MDSNMAKTGYEMQKGAREAIVGLCAIHLLISANGAPWGCAVNNLHNCSVHSKGKRKIQMRQADDGPQMGLGKCTKLTKEVFQLFEKKEEEQEGSGSLVMAKQETKTFNCFQL